MNKLSFLHLSQQIAKEFEAKAAFTRYTNDVIATSAFGIKVNSMKNQDNEFYMHGQAATSFKPSFILKFQLMTLFPKLMKWSGATFLPKSTDTFFKSVINEAVRLRQVKGTIRQDMLHLLVQAMSKEVKEKDCSKVTIEDIQGQAIIFFIAGFETSSSLMSFICHELAANLDVQEKLHLEIDKYFDKKNNDEITYESVNELKYLDMVVNETLRKYPPAAFTNRLCTKDYTFPPTMEGYPEYVMKKGESIFIPIIGFHRDPKYFPNPEKFDPERFNDENKGTIDPYTFIPFGMGPRECIGKRFALMETKIVIINLMRKFAVRFTDKSIHPVVFMKRTFSVTAKDGCWIRFEERKKFD